MKKNISSKQIFSLLLLSLSFLANFASAADIMVTETHPVTSDENRNILPTLGNDEVSDLVVYSSHYYLPTGAAGPGYIYYQRLDNGVPDGDRVQITFGETDDRLNDISGDYIVFTSYESSSSATGEIMLHRISTGETVSLYQAQMVLRPEISGNQIAWREGTIEGTILWYYNLTWLGSSAPPQLITGPIPPVAELGIGDRYIVWSETDSGEYDIFAYDLETGETIQVTDTDTISERQPATIGPWVVFREQNFGELVLHIGAKNLETGEYRSIVSDGSRVTGPKIDGNLIVYEKSTWDSYFDYDLYIHRLSEEDTFALRRPGSQRLNNIFGQILSYVDYIYDENGALQSQNISVSTLQFEPAPEPDITVTPDSFNFGEQEVGTQSSTTIIIANNGNALLNISDISFLCGEPVFTAAISVMPITIEAGESLGVSVSFAPTETGGFPAEMQITSDDPDSGDTIVHFKGTAIPTSTTPEEQIQEIQTLLDGSLAAGTIIGTGPGKSSSGKSKAMINKLNTAHELIEQSSIPEACDQLTSVYKKIDGLPKPPDFLAGESVPELAAEVSELMEFLDCQ